MLLAFISSAILLAGQVGCLSVVNCPGTRLRHATQAPDLLLKVERSARRQYHVLIGVRIP